MSEPDPDRQQPPPAARPRRVSPWQTFRTIAWSFFGVRRRADHDAEVSQLHPVHIVIAGIVGAIVFIVVLVLLVRWVVGSGVAG